MARGDEKTVAHSSVLTALGEVRIAEATATAREAWRGKFKEGARTFLTSGNGVTEKKPKQKGPDK